MFIPISEVLIVRGIQTIAIPCLLLRYQKYENTPRLAKPRSSVRLVVGGSEAAINNRQDPNKLPVP
jgi:hypothetical protein